MRADSMERWRCVLVAVVLLASSGVYRADPPTLIRYKARLVDAAGVALTGTRDLAFEIYDQEMGGSSVWTETWLGVDLGGSGTADLLLGNGGMPLSSSVLAGSNRWLEVTVDGSVLTPRQRLSSVPYALTTDRLGTKTLAEVEADVDADVAAHAVIANVHREHASLEESAEIDADVAAHAVMANAHREHASLEESAEIDADVAAHAGVADSHREHASLEESVEIEVVIETHVGHPDPHTVYVKRAGDTMTGALSPVGLGLPSSFGPDGAFVGTPGNHIAFGHAGASEDFIGYSNNTFFFRDSPGGGDTVQPELDIGGNILSGGTIRAGQDLTTTSGIVNFLSSAASVHTSDSGFFGQANGWDPNPLSNRGIFVEYGVGESGGFYADGDIAVIWSPGDPDLLRVYDEDTLPSGDPRFVIDGFGNVGIGTPSPAYALEIAGDVNTIAGGYRDAGSCVAGTCASDMRLKEDVQPLSSSLRLISQLEPVSFTFIDEKLGPGTQVGLLAQDVEKVFPEWVSDVNEDGYKEVRYGLPLQMHLIQAVKELKAENDVLKRRIQALEAASR